MASIRTIKLTTRERQALEAARDHDGQPYVRERCSAILKIAEGHAPYWVAYHGLLKQRDPDTVYHWLAVYEQDGLPGLKAHRQGGSRRRSL